MRRLLIAIGIIWLGAQPVVTARRVGVFRSSTTLWADAARLNPLMPRAHINLADQYWKQGRQAEAVQELMIAREVTPTAALSPVRKQAYGFLVNVELGNIARSQGRDLEAQVFFWVAAQTDPRMVQWINHAP